VNKKYLEVLWLTLKTTAKHRCILTYIDRQANHIFVRKIKQYFNEDGHEIRKEPRKPLASNNWFCVQLPNPEIFYSNTV